MWRIAAAARRPGDRPLLGRGQGAAAGVEADACPPPPSPGCGRRRRGTRGAALAGCSPACSYLVDDQPRPAGGRPRGRAAAGRGRRRAAAVRRRLTRPGDRRARGGNSRAGRAVGTPMISSASPCSPPPSWARPRFGLWRRRRTDRAAGRAGRRGTAGRGGRRRPLTAEDLGAELGERATLVQFSSAFCAPCRATAVLDEVSGMVDGRRARRGRRRVPPRPRAPPRRPPHADGARPRRRGSGPGPRRRGAAQGRRDRRARHVV